MKQFTTPHPVRFLAFQRTGQALAAQRAATASIFGKFNLDRLIGKEQFGVDFLTGQRHLYLGRGHRGHHHYLQGF